MKICAGGNHAISFEYHQVSKEYDGKPGSKNLKYVWQKTQNKWQGVKPNYLLLAQ